MPEALRWGGVGGGGEGWLAPCLCRRERGGRLRYENMTLYCSRDVPPAVVSGRGRREQGRQRRWQRPGGGGRRQCWRSGGGGA